MKNLDAQSLSHESLEIVYIHNTFRGATPKENKSSGPVLQRLSLHVKKMGKINIFLKASQRFLHGTKIPAKLFWEIHKNK